MTRVLSDQAAALRVTEEACYYQYKLTGEVMGVVVRSKPVFVSQRTYCEYCITAQS